MPSSDRGGEIDPDDALLALVGRIRADIKVEEAFHSLDRILRPWLIAYFRRASSPADADELAQTTLSRVYLNIRGLADESRFVPWLFTIARNVKLTALDRKRKDRERFASGSEGLEDLPDPKSTGGKSSGDGSMAGVALSEEEEVARFRAALEKLPPQQKRCLILQVKGELSYQEIAEMLRLSVNTVRNHLRAARQSLRALLGVDLESKEES